MTEYNKEIVNTYWDMMGVTTFKHKWITGFTDFNTREKFSYCAKCEKRVNKGNPLTNARCCPIPDHIDKSPAELAEYMMRQCDKAKYINALAVVIKETSRLEGYPIELLMATHEQRIDAAVKAWKGKS